jgi:hypothetical protein
VYLDEFKAKGETILKNESGPRREFLERKKIELENIMRLSLSSI